MSEISYKDIGVEEVDFKKEIKNKLAYLEVEKQKRIKQKHTIFLTIYIVSLTLSVYFTLNEFINNVILFKFKNFKIIDYFSYIGHYPEYIFFYVSFIVSSILIFMLNGIKKNIKITIFIFYIITLIFTYYITI